MTRVIEPLDPVTWFCRLAKLLAQAEDLDVDSQQSVIRQAYHLVRLAPEPFRGSLPVDLDEHRVESMLDCDAYESAVMALLGAETSFTLQKDPGVNEMSVVMSGDARSAPGHGHHQSGAKAMVQAWIRCLANTAGVRLPENSTNPGPHKSRCGSPQSSTAH